MKIFVAAKTGKKETRYELCAEKGMQKYTLMRAYRFWVLV